jgi:NADH-quinone oxidoreductase subunit G
MPKLTIDGKEIEVEAGTNLIEAARRLGIEVPHYCYHPALAIAGQCRLCMVDIEKAPRPTIACNTTATDGMVVLTDTPRVRETRRSMMEFHLINHPLDCPVCDQAGECFLQIYYMKYGLYDPRMVDEKVHKPKAVPLGPHVMLDAERCILCSRCVRFCDEITGTGELGIFHRGDHSEIGLFPGRASRCASGTSTRPSPSAPGARAAATSRCTSTVGGRTTPRAGGWRASSRA